MGQKSSRLQREARDRDRVDAAPDAPRSKVTFSASTKRRPNTATDASARTGGFGTVADPTTANVNVKPRRRSIQLPARFRPSSSKGRLDSDKEKEKEKENVAIGVQGKKPRDLRPTSAPASKPALVPSAPPNIVESKEVEARVKLDEPTSPPGLLVKPVLKLDSKSESQSDRAAAIAAPESVPPPIALGSVPDAPHRPSPRLRIAIVGGGIGGLSLAAFLKLSSLSSDSNAADSDAEAPGDDLEISIYEAAPSLTELGAGVGMWLRTWRIMRAFSERGGGEDREGINETLEAETVPEDVAGKEEEQDTLVAGLTKIAPAGRDMGDALRKAFEFRMGEAQARASAGGENDGKTEGEGRSFYTMEVPFGVLTLHRADFQQVIARHAIPPAVPHFGKRLVDYVEDPTRDAGAGAITLHFTDGTRAECDLLVGADGIRSVTRGAMYRRLVQSGEVRLPGTDLPLPSEPIQNPTSNANANEVGDDNENVANGEAKADVDTDTSQPARAPSPTPLAPPSPTTPLDPVADFVDPVWSGTLVYRALIPKAALDAAWPRHRAGMGPVCYFGKSKHVLAFPIMHTTPAPAASADPTKVANDSDTASTSSESRAPAPTATATPMVNLVAFTSQPAREGTRIDGAWVRPAPATNLLAEFAGWEGEVRALLALVADPLLWAIHTVRPLPRYSDGGRVVLLGDAAHAMTPHQGAGGGQAIEDAYVLAALLAHPRTDRRTLGHALAAYDRVRVPVSQAVARKSRLNGMLYELNAGAGLVVGSPSPSPSAAAAGEKIGSKEEEEEEERLRALAEAIMEIHKWEWEEPAEGQVREAVRYFEDLLASSGGGGVVNGNGERPPREEGEAKMLA